MPSEDRFSPEAIARRKAEREREMNEMKIRDAEEDKAFDQLNDRINQSTDGFDEIAFDVKSQDQERNDLIAEARAHEAASNLIQESSNLEAQALEDQDLLNDMQDLDDAPEISKAQVLEEALSECVEMLNNVLIEKPTRANEQPLEFEQEFIEDIMKRINDNKIAAEERCQTAVKEIDQAPKGLNQKFKAVLEAVGNKLKTALQFVKTQAATLKERAPSLKSKSEMEKETPQSTIRKP